MKWNLSNRRSNERRAKVPRLITRHYGIEAILDSVKSLKGDVRMRRTTGARTPVRRIPRFYLPAAGRQPGLAEFRPTGFKLPEREAVARVQENEEVNRATIFLESVAQSIVSFPREHEPTQRMSRGIAPRRDV